MCGREYYMNEFEAKMLEAIHGLSERITRVETKLDRVDTHEVRITEIEKRIPDPDHETRIRKLEKAVWVASGVAAAAGGTVGSFLAPILGG